MQALSAEQLARISGRLHLSPTEGVDWVWVPPYGASQGCGQGRKFPGYRTFVTTESRENWWSRSATCRSLTASFAPVSKQGERRRPLKPSHGMVDLFVNNAQVCTTQSQRPKDKKPKDPVAYSQCMTARHYSDLQLAYR
jgi:hypothetical protein